MSGDARNWLDDELAQHRISRVTPNPERAGALVNMARKHIASARSLAESDPTLAVAACHDAIRKSVDAHCGANGYRIENRQGAHIRAIEYARHVIGVSESVALELDHVRTRRHAAEYGSLPEQAFRVDEIMHAASLAELVVNRVADLLASPQKPPSPS